uniref:Alpha/beta hydrolase fold-3 domain-containing protein n=1 Tax=Helicotheca tamesis TaxID=374047 RepID=A0A7S2IG95_9STRA|mmetsp:Transcript_9114/g.12657  ORF Transcript_9114/g.12657 Transcript_9114/m.12657 type:complete len:428 (-) Transcript_9114:78-1361(-)
MTKGCVAVSLGILAVVLGCMITKLSTFEGGPHDGLEWMQDRIPHEAVPIWKHPDLSLGNKIFDYLFPLICPLGTMVGCPTSIDKDNMSEATLCMKPFKDFATKAGLMWTASVSGSYDASSKYIEKTIYIPRPIFSDPPLEVTLVRRRSSLVGDTFQLHANAPLVLWLHGGGFTVGTSRDDHMLNFMDRLDDTAMPSLADDLVWASVEYRLAPEHKYPAASDDAILALRHLIQEQNLGQGGIHIAGASAGGLLAMETTLRALKLNIPVHTFLVDSPMVPLANNIANKTHALDSESFRRNTYCRINVPWLHWCYESYAPSANNDITGGSMTPREWVRASKNNPDKFPPLFLITGKADPLQSGGIAFKEVYEDALASRGNTNTTMDKVYHVDLSSTHCSHFMFDAANFRAIVDDWHSEMNHIWESKQKMN